MHSEKKTTQAIHGAFDYSELERLGLDAKEILDFSVNSNPYGPSPLVRRAIADVALEDYPDRECLKLRRAILEHELPTTPLPLDTIVCGNGTAELIWTIARAYLRPGEKAALIGPTFGEYHAACQAVGASIVSWEAVASADFKLNIPAVIAWLQLERPALLWLCNPNNPTGMWLSQAALTQIAIVCQQLQTVLVVDEAYRRFLVPRDPFSATALFPIAQRTPLIVLRSLTKDFALAGLRLGYVIVSDVSVASRLQAQLPAWNVSSLAQAAGIAALQDRLYLNTTLAQLEVERLAFFQALHSAALSTIPSRTHFTLIEVGDAAAVRQRLLARKILVRDCTSFDLPQFIRVVTRIERDWRQLLAALQEIL